MTSPQANRPVRSQYEDFMRHVYATGVTKADRTGTGTANISFSISITVLM